MMMMALLAALGVDHRLTVGVPEQLHIAYGAANRSMVICWATKKLSDDQVDPPQQIVRWGPAGSDRRTWNTTDAKTQLVKSYYKHRATLTGLDGGRPFAYEVGDLTTWRFVSSAFESQREDVEWSPRIAMFGDVGWTNDQVLPLLREEAAAGDVDAIVLFGDMIYWANGESENAFMRDVSSMSANGSIPFHVTPGNGDSGGNFSIYRGDFAMPGWEDGSSDSLWHSFDLGRAHIVGISTEAFYYQDAGVQTNMMAWLRADLTAANAPDARRRRPWIVVHYHRPCYSTNSGVGFSDRVAHETFEPLMFEFGVDVIFEGHVHSQERTWPVYAARTALHAPLVLLLLPSALRTALHARSVPCGCYDRQGLQVATTCTTTAAAASTASSPPPPLLPSATALFQRADVAHHLSPHVHGRYNGTVLNGSSGEPYHNGRGPVHIVSGNPSNAEGTSVFESGVAPWAAWRSYTPGYSHLNVVNESALYVDIVSSTLGGGVVDDVWITKDQPCSFGRGCRATSGFANAPSDAASEVPAPPADEPPARLRHEQLNLAPRIEKQQRQRRSTPPDQLAALWSLYSSLGGAGWTRSNGWVHGGDPCTDARPWYGVSCTPVTDVTMPDLYDAHIGGISAILLPGNGLRGDISTLDLSPLLHANLQALDVSDNFLFGLLPPSIFSSGAPKLHTLHLDSREAPEATGAGVCKLTGSLPANMGSALPNLKSFALQRHALRGSLPASLGRVDCSTRYTAPQKQACRFWLRDNGFSGAPPMELCNNTFDEIYLMGNNFTCGTMPCFHCAYCSKGDDQVTPCKKSCRPC
jgi:hypothetical protein